MSTNFRNPVTYARALAGFRLPRASSNMANGHTRGVEFQYSCRHNATLGVDGPELVNRACQIRTQNMCHLKSSERRGVSGFLGHYCSLAQAAGSLKGLKLAAPTPTAPLYWTFSPSQFREQRYSLQSIR